ncbi:MAG TPA: hypothetical protein VGB89_01785, partial [Bacteroidota bacterium]
RHSFQPARIQLVQESVAGSRICHFEINSAFSLPRSPLRGLLVYILPFTSLCFFGLFRFSDLFVFE